MIILVTIGEPIPKIDNDQRYMRCFNLGLNFSENGNKVLWITDSFNHQKKIQRDLSISDEVNINNNFKIKIIKTISYKKNYSLNRVFHNIEFSYKLFKFIKTIKIDKRLFIASYPILESCVALALLKKKEDKLIIDIRDLWPDIFKDKINFILFKIINLIYKLLLKFIFHRTDMTISTSEGYLNWSEKYNNISKKYSLPIGYNLSIYESEHRQNFKQDNYKNINFKRFNICFIGTITKKYFDFDIINELSKFLKKNSIEHNLFIAGYGEDFEEIKSNATKETIMLGQLNGNELKDIMSICSIGLAPYRNIPNFEMNIPNKIYEYASNNLYLITSLQGETKSFIEKNKLGYSSNNVHMLSNKILNIYNNFGTTKFLNNRGKKNILNSEKINRRFFNELKKLHYL